MVKIEFTKDYATRKKGDVWECQGTLATKLIKEGVAKKFDGKKKPANKNGKPKGIEKK